MATLTLPTLARLAPTVVSFRLFYNTQSFESPLNRTVQTLELPGARWMATIEYKNLQESDARILKAFLAQLRGAAGRFYLGDLSHGTPSGTALGNPLVKGASQVGTSLVTDGWTPDQTSLLFPGDYFSVNGELKLVTAVCVSDGSGNATITFEPPLRAAPADNAPLTVINPVATFRLKDDEQDQMQIDPDRFPTVTFEAVETF